MSSRFVQRRNSSLRLQETNNIGAPTSILGRHKIATASTSSPAVYYVNTALESGYISQNTDSLLSPRYTGKGRDREFGYRSQAADDGSPNIHLKTRPRTESSFRRSRSIPPRRRNYTRSRNGELKTDRPIRIRQHKPSFHRAEVLARGVDNLGKKVIFISYNPVLEAQGIPIASLQTTPPFCRSLSAAPELERVRQWLHQHDFNKDVDGTSQEKLEARCLKSDIQTVTECLPVQSPTTSPLTVPESLSQKRHPPQPVQLSQKSSHENVKTEELAVEHPPASTPLTSLQASSVTQPLQAQDMTASVPNNKGAFKDLQHPSDKSCTSTTNFREGRRPSAQNFRHLVTTTQKHVEEVVDSIFARALGDYLESRNDQVGYNVRGNDNDKNVVLKGNLKSVFATSLQAKQVTTSNGLADLTYNGVKSVDAALLELKGRMTSQSLGSEKSYNSANEMQQLSQKQHSGIIGSNSKATSDVDKLLKFEPLATSTPPPTSSASPKLQLHQSGPQDLQAPSVPSPCMIAPTRDQPELPIWLFIHHQSGQDRRDDTHVTNTPGAAPMSPSASDLTYNEKLPQPTLTKYKEKSHRAEYKRNESPYPKSETRSRLQDLRRSHSSGEPLRGGDGPPVQKGFGSVHSIFRSVVSSRAMKTEEVNSVKITLFKLSHSVLGEIPHAGEIESARRTFGKKNYTCSEDNTEPGEELLNNCNTSGHTEGVTDFQHGVSEVNPDQKGKKQNENSYTTENRLLPKSNPGQDLTEREKRHQDLKTGDCSNTSFTRKELISILFTQGRLIDKSTDDSEHCNLATCKNEPDRFSQSVDVNRSFDITSDTNLTGGGGGGGGSSGRRTSNAVPDSQLGSADHTLPDAAVTVTRQVGRGLGPPAEVNSRPALHEGDTVLLPRSAAAEPTPLCHRFEKTGSDNQHSERHFPRAEYLLPSAVDSEPLPHEGAQGAGVRGVLVTNCNLSWQKYEESITVFGSEPGQQARTNAGGSVNSQVIPSAGHFNSADWQEPIKSSDLLINSGQCIDFYLTGLCRVIPDGSTESGSTDSRVDVPSSHSLVISDPTVSEPSYPHNRLNASNSFKAGLSTGTEKTFSASFNDNVDDETSGWTSDSSSETNFQRFASTATSQESLNSLFIHGASVSFRVRADRSLTGSQHNITSGWPFHLNDDTQENSVDNRSGFSRQAHSAPSSARLKKQWSKSLSTVKFLTGSVFSAKSKSPISNVITHDLNETRFVQNSGITINNDNDDTEQATYHGPTSPTTIEISSNSDGSKLVRIFPMASAATDLSAEHDARPCGPMLGNHNHDHEMLPPSAASSANSKNGLAHNSTGSLLRSKSLFSSTPSLFARSSPEGKFWKKEMKREKEEKKKMEEEKKRQEKLQKKEEKKRRKLEKKTATLTTRTMPRNWDYVVRPIESVYMRPKLVMRAVPIEYTDDPRIPPPHQPPPPPPGRHYATSSVALRGGYTIYASNPDLARVEQVYGTSHRYHRPPPVLLTPSHYASPYVPSGYSGLREQAPRVVLLHRSAEGYGFVLRGAKSKLPTGGGFNDFTPTAEYPALQYLDSVDPGSQADRASLKAGDFILEINGENVVRASHEHVVHLIRSSSDVLTLKVVTVSPADRTPADWFSHPDSGAMTLPSRKKQAAPLPPQRDPRTSLSYSKASSRSMTEGLAEIEKLDAAIAEFEGQEAIRRHSLHGLQAAEDPKVASVRASHTVKRVSVVDYDGLISGEPVISASPKSGRDHMGPAEARIKKYHKKSASQGGMERSKSTPDILSAVDQQYNDSGPYVFGKISGSWNKGRAPPPPPAHSSAYSGILQPSPPTESFNVMGAVSSGSGPYGRRNSAGTPEVPDRIPVNPKTAPGAPPTPEVVRIHTGVKNATYANISAEIQNQKNAESPYESSFRPGINAKLVDHPKGLAPNPEQTILKNKKNTANQNIDKSISFADERVMENAQKFIQKYPNATVLVTADIHCGKTDGNKTEKSILYEPEPDYDDSDDDKAVFTTVDKENNGAPKSASNMSNSNTVVRQNRASVTVISISSDGNKGGNKQVVNSSPPSNHSSPCSVNSAKSSPSFPHSQENTTLASPVQSLSSSRRSSGIVMATPSQPSSAESSRRSSIQSNLSGDNGDKNGKIISTSGISVSKSDSSHRFIIGSDVPPPPVPGPPPPPAPPLPSAVGANSSSPNSSANSTLRRRPPEPDAASVLPNRVSAEDILAAVAERRNRLETEGPRVSDVKSLPTGKSNLQLNQEALKAAVAKRKTRIEQGQDKSVVNEIEARLQRNKKLQAVKYFGGDVSRGETKNEEPAPSSPPESTPLPPPLATAAPIKVEDQVDSGTLKAKEIASRFEPNKSTSQVKLSPVVPVKANQNKDKPASAVKTSESNGATLDFRAKLKPVGATLATSAVSSSSVPKSPNPGSNVSIAVAKANSSKAPAPPPPPPPPSSSIDTTIASATVSSASSSPSNTKMKTDLPLLLTSKTGTKPNDNKTTSPAPISSTSNMGATSPASPNCASAADYITLAEKARQEYLKKKASGNLQANIEKKGPVDITPNKKRNPLSPTSASKPIGPTLTEVKPAPDTGDKVQISIGDRIKSLQSGNSYANGKASVAGVTEDHSHTEQSLSNGTIKKAKAIGSISPSTNFIVPPPPPPGFGDGEANSAGSRGVVIDIVPPPSTFSIADESPDPLSKVPAFGQDDKASFVSSISSLSTLSSEYGDGVQQDKISIEDLIVPPPPPPPDFGDSTLGDQDAYIPPPPEFLEIDSNANESKAMDKNSRPFATKAVAHWSCMDVLDWLDSLGLPQYRVSFAKACIDGSKLVNMGRSEFINLGISQVGHRMNLERSVKKLSMAASTNL